MHTSLLERRVLACLQGIATGDAIGKQTEGLARDAIRTWYPDAVRGFEGSPGSTIPRYIGNAKHEWRIGETTDDTERTMAVARAIVQDRDVRHVSVGRELLRCVKCVHPGIKSLWEFHREGDPARIAPGAHNGCGAAVRVAPVGILYRSERLEALVRGAREASISTHGGPVAIAAAAATAAAVSGAIDEASAAEIVELAVRGATLAERLWPGPADTAVAEAIQRLYHTVSRGSELRPDRVVLEFTPDDTLTIVPLALALATTMESAETAILVATNIGGDSDSVASIAGGILGARFPPTVNAAWQTVVEQVNGHDLARLASDLCALRH